MVERTVVERTVVERTVVERTSGGKHLSPAYTSPAVCHVICSLSRDPLDYVRLIVNIALDYGISARGKIGTL